MARCCFWYASGECDCPIETAGHDRRDPEVAALPELWGQADAVEVQTDLPAMQDDGGGVLRGQSVSSGWIKVEPLGYRVMTADFSPWYEPTVCLHRGGYEPSNLTPGAYVCVDCGDYMPPQFAETPAIANGKGDSPRPVDQEAYDRNYEAIFGKTRKHVCRQWTKMPDGTTACYHCGQVKDN